METPQTPGPEQKIEQRRSVAILRWLITDAIQKQLVQEKDAAAIIRWLDSAD